MENTEGLSIHVVDSTPREDAKRRSENGRDRPAKKPKHKSPAAEASVRPVDRLPVSAPHVQSFRHLFSFGSKDVAAAPTANQWVGKPAEKVEKPSFSLLGALPADVGIPSTSSSGQDSTDESSEDEIEHSTAVNLEHDGPGYDYVGNDDDRNDKPHARGDVRWHDSSMRERSDDQMDVEERPVPELQPLKFIDPFDEAAVAQIADRFCRQKTLDQLEEDWDGFLRNDMRRSFKVRRQIATRGRKLGVQERAS